MPSSIQLLRDRLSGVPVVTSPARRHRFEVGHVINSISNISRGKVVSNLSEWENNGLYQRPSLEFLLGVFFAFYV